MKKIIILILFISSFSFAINIEKGNSELKTIKKELIVKYKKELGIDFEDFDKNEPNHKRIFNETLYLKFLSKYIPDIKDVKVYSSQDTNNVMIFANNLIQEDVFDDIFEIIQKNDKNKKLKLIQVPENEGRNKFYGVMQEKSSERE